MRICRVRQFRTRRTVCRPFRQSARRQNDYPQKPGERHSRMDKPAPHIAQCGYGKQRIQPQRQPVQGTRPRKRPCSFRSNGRKRVPYRYGRRAFGRRAPGRQGKRCQPVYVAGHAPQPVYAAVAQDQPLRRNRRTYRRTVLGRLAWFEPYADERNGIRMGSSTMT